MDQLEFPVSYAVGRDGKVWKELPSEKGDDLTNVPGDTTPLLDEIINSIPSPAGDLEGEFQMQVSALDFDQHHGKLLIGKISQGSVSVNDQLLAINADDPDYKLSGKVKILSVREGLEYKQVDEAYVGDLISISGMPDVTIGGHPLF